MVGSGVHLPHRKLTIAGGNAIIGHGKTTTSRRCGFVVSRHVPLGTVWGAGNAARDREGAGRRRPECGDDGMPPDRLPRPARQTFQATAGAAVMICGKCTPDPIRPTLMPTNQKMKIGVEKAPRLSCCMLLSICSIASPFMIVLFALFLGERSDILRHLSKVRPGMHQKDVVRIMPRRFIDEGRVSAHEIPLGSYVANTAALPSYYMRLEANSMPFVLDTIADVYFDSNESVIAMSYSSDRGPWVPPWSNAVLLTIDDVQDGASSSGECAQGGK